MDEEIQKPEPKISDVEIVLIGMFYFGLDVLDFIPMVGDVTDVVAAPMGFYYWMKGLNGTAFLASEAIEAIPGAQELPFVRSITWGINIWLDRHPKLEAKFATVEAIGGALDGGELGEAEGLTKPQSISAETAGGSISGEAQKQGAVGVSEVEGSQGGTAQPDSTTNNRPSDQGAERDINKNESESERESHQGLTAQSGSNKLGEDYSDEPGNQEKTDEEQREDARKEEAGKALRQGAEILPEEEAMKADFPEEEAVRMPSNQPQAKSNTQRRSDGIHLVRPPERNNTDNKDRDDSQSGTKMPHAA